MRTLEKTGKERERENERMEKKGETERCGDARERWINKNTYAYRSFGTYEYT